MSWPLGTFSVLLFTTVSNTIQYSVERAPVSSGVSFIIWILFVDMRPILHFHFSLPASAQRSAASATLCLFKAIICHVQTSGNTAARAGVTQPPSSHHTCDQHLRSETFKWRWWWLVKEICIQIDDYNNSTIIQIIQIFSTDSVPCSVQQL